MKRLNSPPESVSTFSGEGHHDLPDQPRAVFISRTGFQKGAKEVAKANGIKLYEMRAPKDSDWDGFIKTVKIELNIALPRVSSVKVIYDREWLKREYKEFTLQDEINIEIASQATANRVVLYNENNETLGSVSSILHRLFRNNTPESSWRKSSYFFEQPTFTLTANPNVPKIKLTSIDAEISQRFIKTEIRIDAADAVGLILKDIFTEKEMIFDENLALRTIPSSN